jgi:hypothetical protein
MADVFVTAAAVKIVGLAVVGEEKRLAFGRA